MKRYQQNATHIGIWANGETYIGTVDDFALDYGQPVPALPDTILDRVYEPGVRHALHGVNGVNPHMDAECPREWPTGDAVIAAIYDLRVKQAERECEAKIVYLRGQLANAIETIRSREAAVKDAVEQSPGA